MPKPTDTFKKRKYVCVGETPHHFEDLRWESQGAPAVCPVPNCGKPTELDLILIRQAHGVIGDEIDIMVRHGLCNDDGTPRRFRSMTDLRRAAAEKGLVISGETPNVTQYQRDREEREAEAKYRGR